MSVAIDLGVSEELARFAAGIKRMLAREISDPKSMPGGNLARRSSLY